MLRDAAREFQETLVRRRVAARFAEDRYAKRLMAMSLAEAKAILGFPPSTTPSADEINKAYKRKALENHPDRGGDPKKMVDINVAKDVLDGKQRPTGSPASRPSGWRDEDRASKKTVRRGRDFDNARSHASLPKVEWKFRSASIMGSATDFATDQSKAQEGEVGTGLNAYVIGWVCYGQTASQHVFLLVEHAVPNNFGEVQWDEWCMEAVETYPLTQDISKLAPKAIKALLGKGKLLTSSRAPTKFTSMAKLTEAEIQRREGGVNLKDILIGTGLVSGGSSESMARKTVIELSGKINPTKDRENRTKPVGQKVVFNADVWKLCDFTLYVNGKAYPLSDQTVENLNRIGSTPRGGLFWLAVYANVEYDYTRKRVLTKIPGYGAQLIEWVEEALHNEPPELTVSLLKAIEELEPQAKAKKARMSQNIVARFVRTAA